MIKKSLLVTSLLLSSLCATQEIELNGGWELLGATEEFSLKSIDSSCVKYVWTYDNNSWKVYTQDKSIALPTNVSELININQGEGFWINTNTGGCDISLKNTTELFKSTAVQDGVNLLKNLTASDSLEDTLTTIKNSLNSNNEDENLMLAFIDIIEILNSETVQSLVDINDNTTFSLDFLLSDMEYKIELAQDATLIGGIEVLHMMAQKLKTSSDTISKSFNSLTRVMSYDENVSINYYDALAIRASALSVASALELISSYTWGENESVLPKIANIGEVKYDGFMNIYPSSNVPENYSYLNYIVNTSEVEYIPALADPISLLEQDSFFKMNDTTRLTKSGEYLKESITIASMIDISKFSEPQSITQEEIDIAKELKNVFDGDGIYTNGYNKVNIKNLFDSNYYIDREDYPMNFKYVNKAGDTISSLHTNYSYITNKPMYFAFESEFQYWYGFDTLNELKEWNQTKYNIYFKADIKTTGTFNSSSSSLDEVIITIENENGTGSISIEEALTN